MVACSRLHLVIKISSSIWWARPTFLTHTPTLMPQAGKCWLIYTSSWWGDAGLSFCFNFSLTANIILSFLCWERVTLVLISCPIICVIFQENVWTFTTDYWSCVSCGTCIGRWIFYHWATGETQIWHRLMAILLATQVGARLFGDPHILLTPCSKEYSKEYQGAFSGVSLLLVPDAFFPAHLYEQ